MSIQTTSSLSCSWLDFESFKMLRIHLSQQWQDETIQLFNWGTNANNLKINSMLVLRQSSNLRYGLAGVLKSHVKLMEASWPWQHGAQKGLVQLAGYKHECYVHTLCMILSIRLHLARQTTRVGLHTGPRMDWIFLPVHQLPSLALCCCANLSVVSEHFDFGRGAVYLPVLRMVGGRVLLILHVAELKTEMVVV